MNKIRQAAIIVITILSVCITLASCANSTGGAGEEALGDEQTKTTDSAYVENQISTALANTPAWDGWAPSVAEMINTVFHSYEWKFESYQDSKTNYIAEFSGTYSPNPNIPNLSQSGSISYLVNIETGQVQTYSDPNRISSVFMVYIVG